MLKTSWVSRQKVEMDRRMKKSEPKATYCRDRDRDRERGEFAQSYHYESTTGGRGAFQHISFPLNLINKLLIGII